MLPLRPPVTLLVSRISRVQLHRLVLDVWQRHHGFSWQEEQHRKISFQEALLSDLKVQEIELDQRYT